MEKIEEDPSSKKLRIETRTVTTTVLLAKGDILGIYKNKISKRRHSYNYLYR